MDNIGALNFMYPMYNQYFNQTAMYDMYDNYGCGNYYTNPMNSSIFGTMPFAPTFGGGMNYDSYYRNMNDYLNFTSQYSLNNIERQRNLELEMNAPDEGIQKAAAILREKIAQNEQEQIQGALQNLKNAVRAKYPNQSEEWISNRTGSIYKQLYQVSMTDDIREKGSNSFLQGFKQSISLGFADNKTAEENIAQIYGQPVSRQQKMEKGLGRAAGGAVVGTSAVLATRLIPGLKHLKGKWAIIGGIAGAAIAGLTSLFNVREK